jgi:fatty acid desaturase
MSATRHFSIPQARRILSDLFRHRPAIYWTDFLISLTVGYAAASVYLGAPLGSAPQVLGLLVASFALFRVGSFIHEIVHFGKDQMRPFTVAWDILAGVPMLMPSFFYGNHIDHHNTQHYGTGQDGEYLPLGSGPLRNIAKFYAQVVVLPILVAFRFLVITPVSFLHPRLRRWALQHASSYVINLRYRRRQIPAGATRKYWAFLEILCFLRTATIFGAVAVGLTPWYRVPLLYLLAVCILGLNYVRNLVAHRYRGNGDPMSHADQLLDSVNIEGGRFLGGPITELFFPLGLRYHALHHLFPALPYHNLYAAHRRLMAELPANSAYRETVYPSFWAVVHELLARAKRASALERRRTTTRADQWFEKRRQLLSNTATQDPTVSVNQRSEVYARRA